MHEQNIPLHQTMELHELLNFKTACLLKSKMMQGLVFDQELKALLQKDVEKSIRAVNILQDLLPETNLQ